jgi:hypothetical protein
MAGERTVDERTKAAGKREAGAQAKVSAKEQKQYTKDKASAKTLIKESIGTAKKVKTLADKKGDTTQKKDARDYLKTLQDIEPIINKLGDDASNIYKGDLSVLRSDIALRSEGSSGVSTSGKYYLNGQEVSQTEYVNGLDKATKDKSYQSAVDRIRAENPGWTEENILRTAKDEVYGTERGAGGGGAASILASDAEVSEEKRNAFAILAETFAAYGLEDLAPVIEEYMKQDLGVEEASLQLKQTKQYQTRFSGNEMRRKAGLNVISESDYLNLEDKYSEILKSYGQAGYFGVDRKTRQEKMSQLIGLDISAVEFQDRVQTVAERVNNADPMIKTQLRSLYNITDEDLVGYFLNPKESLPKLKEKVAAAEVASAASNQGLSSGVLSSEELSKYGVDLETARKGYATIADILPTASKLGEIYKEEGISYNQGTAEQETFKGLASAQRKRQRLAEKEIGAFGGRSGLTSASLGKTLSGLI